jgi:hypothetical protein
MEPWLRPGLRLFFRSVLLQLVDSGGVAILEAWPPTGHHLAAIGSCTPNVLRIVWLADSDGRQFEVESFFRFGEVFFGPQAKRRQDK